MPHWTNTPPPDGRGNSLPLHRTPQYKPINGIITSVDIVGTPTHYWGGRTVPCDVEDCDACNHGIPWRWHGYFSAFNPETMEHFLFEVTSAAAENLLLYRQANGTLRGCLFTAHRPARTANGRVTLRCRPADLQKYKIPQPPDVIAALCLIWGIAEPSAKISGLMDKLPRVVVDANGDGRLWAPSKPPAA